MAYNNIMMWILGIVGCCLVLSLVYWLIGQYAPYLLTGEARPTPDVQRMLAKTQMALDAKFTTKPTVKEAVEVAKQSLRGWVVIPYASRKGWTGKDIPRDKKVVFVLYDEQCQFDGFSLGAYGQLDQNAYSVPTYMMSS